MQRLTASQKRYINKFKQFVDIDSLAIINDEFKKDVERIRLMTKEELSPDCTEATVDQNPLTQLMLKYRLPATMYNFVTTYLEFNTIEPDMLIEGVYIVSDRDKTAVPKVVFMGNDSSWSSYQDTHPVDSFLGKRNYELKIVVSPHVTINEIVTFIRANKDFIKEKQALALDEAEKMGRISPRPNQVVYNEILEYHDQKMKSSEIAIKINDKYKKHYTDAEINVAINRAIERKNNI